MYKYGYFIALEFWVVVGVEAWTRKENVKVKRNSIRVSVWKYKDIDGVQISTSTEKRSVCIRTLSKVDDGRHTGVSRESWRQRWEQSTPTTTERLLTTLLSFPTTPHVSWSTRKPHTTHTSPQKRGRIESGIWWSGDKNFRRIFLDTVLVIRKWINSHRTNTGFSESRKK